MTANNEKPVYVGTDVGASHTKVVILDHQKNMIGYAAQKSGTDFTHTAHLCLEEAMAMAGVSLDDIKNAFSTGYGRKNVELSKGTKTEIGCHGKGCYHYFPEAITIVDIGGQDNKVIKLGDDGRRVSFKMNRKCAAGTGAFLEEMAMRLDLRFEDLDGLARISEDMVELGSYCTVFSATEVLEKIKQGRKVPDIVKGLFFSVIKRIMEMDSLSQTVVMTGGVVAHNAYLVDMVKEITGRDVRVPEHPQLTGALGAALYAMEEAS